MKERVFSLFALFLVALYSHAQIMQPAILRMESLNGNKEEYFTPSINKTLDGGFILCINTASSSGNINTSCSPTGERVLYRKYDAHGTLQWEKCEEDNQFYYPFITSNGDMVIGGYKSVGGRQFLAKRDDVSGNNIWSKQYGGSGDEFLKGMITTPDSSYILFGKTNSTDGDVGFHYGGVFEYDFWVLKINGLGDIIWKKVLGGTGDEDARGICAAPNGGCYLVGATSSNDYDCTGLHKPGQYYDAYVARVDSQGNVLWHRNIGSDQGGYGLAITDDGLGGVYMAAFTRAKGGDANNSHIGMDDFWCLHIDSTNNILFSKFYGSSNSNEKPASICRATDGTVWIAGYCNDTGGQVGQTFGNGDAWIVNVAKDGTFLKAKVLGASKSDYATFVYPLDGGVVFTGGTYEAAGSPNGEFPSVYGGGLYDAFLTSLAPWTTSVHLAKKTNQPEIGCYPNPAENRLFIENKNTDTFSVQITNADGQLIYTGDIKSGIQEISTTNWSRGIYLLEAKNAKSSVKQKIILK